MSPSSVTTSSVCQVPSAWSQMRPRIAQYMRATSGRRSQRVRPGPDFALVRPEHEEAQGELLPPSVAERRLRARIGEMVAAQAVEDEGEMRAARGQGSYHRYNAALKRAMGGKGRGQMTLAELEATAAWLERNRLCDHLHLLDGDARYAWTARRLGRNGSAQG